MNASSVLCSAILLAFAVAGCTSTPQKSRAIPSTSAQKPEELGSQSTGRIVEILKSADDAISPDNAPLTFGEFLILPFVPFVLFTGDLLNLVAPSNAEPGQIDNALDAVKNEDNDSQWRLNHELQNKENLIRLCRAADQGQVNVRNELGKMYYYGSDQYRIFENVHLTADLSRSCMWFHLAGQENITVENEVKDIPESYETVEVERTAKAMTANEIVEANNLILGWEPGQCNHEMRSYFDSRHAEAPAFAWLCTTADRGDFTSRDVLGQIYFYGLKGVKPDLPRAYMWYHLAAKVYMPPSNRGDIRQVLCDDMTPEQQAIAVKLIAEWKPGKCEQDLIHN